MRKDRKSSQHGRSPWLQTGWKIRTRKSYELIIDGNENRIETNKFSLEVRANIES